MIIIYIMIIIIYTLKSHESNSQLSSPTRNLFPAEAKLQRPGDVEKPMGNGRKMMCSRKWILWCSLFSWE